MEERVNKYLYTQSEIRKQWHTSNMSKHMAYELVIPKGTKCILIGDASHGYFVKDLSWIDKDSALYIDATFYSIRLTREEIEQVDDSDPHTVLREKLLGILNMYSIPLGDRYDVVGTDIMAIPEEDFSQVADDIIKEIQS